MEATTVRLFQLIAFWFCVAGVVAFADPPKPLIVGPTGGQPGDILLLDATQSVADHFAWSVTPKLPEGRPTILPIEDGRKCLVTSVPGAYSVFLAASNAEGVKIVEWGVTVGGDPRPPTPGPNPPGPTPPTPPTPDRFGLKAAAQQWAAAVNSPNRFEDAHQLAGAFEAAAAEIVAGTETQPQAFIAILAKHCIQAVPTDRRAAWSSFDAAFAAAVNELYKAGKVAGRDDWAVMFREISAGLAAVR
jgi:hypothetical protein